MKTGFGQGHSERGAPSEYPLIWDYGRDAPGRTFGRMNVRLIKTWWFFALVAAPNGPTGSERKHVALRKNLTPEAS